MKHTKILFTAIFKDDSEYEMIERMLSSFMPYCQGIICAITGIDNKTGIPSVSTKLQKLIKSYKGKFIITSPASFPKLYSRLEDGTLFFSHFAEARNVVTEEADKLDGYDWYTWADADDMLVGGEELQAVADKAHEASLDAVLFTYWYSIRRNKDGTFTENDILIDHLKERLLKPKIFRWVSRLHEVQVAKDQNYKPVYSNYSYLPKENQNIAWAHLPDDKRASESNIRNIRILNIQIEEEHYKDPRTINYLAKTHYDMHTKKDDDIALDLLAKYLEMSGWAEERAIAWHYIGNIYARREEHQKAIDAYLKSIKEFPMIHMTYLYLSREYAEIGMQDISNFYVQVALKMDPPQTRTTIGNPLEIKLTAASLMYNQCQRKLDLDGAIYWLKIRNKLLEEDDNGMLETLEAAKRLNEAAKWAFNYAKWLKDEGHVNKVPKLLESLPPELGREAFAHYIANEVNEPKVWGKKTIVYYASWGADHFEQWSPKSIDSGIGGSERAVIELAKRWTKKGYDVTVYGDPRDDEGDYEGVHYKPWYEINWHDTFNTLILWRSPHLLDKDIKAHHLFMDLHDVASQIDWTDERMKKIDKIFFKSRFHRSMVPKLPENKAVIISNGI